MDLERGSVSSSLRSTPGDAADDAEAVTTDQTEMEAAEILAALAHSRKREAVSVSAEFATKWGCKGKRVKKRVSSSESPPSDIGLNPVDPVLSASDLAEVRAAVGEQKIQVTSTTVVIESVEAEQNAESPNESHPCAARYTSNGVAGKEARRLHSLLTNTESDWKMICERQISLSIVGKPEKDIWEDSQQNQMTGNKAFIKSVKAEENAEPVKSNRKHATKYMSGGGGRSRQNLTEAEKEARRLRRILANRESARQTIRRRQALCEKLNLKVADLMLENENLKRAKELALKEYQSQESTNKTLKAELARAIKSEEGKAPEEVKSTHQISGPSRNFPFFFYNQQPFPSFGWPSIVPSSHPIQSQYGNQNANVFPSSISSPNNGRLASSHDQENSISDNGPKNPIYVMPYPWFLSLPDHGNGLHCPPACGLNNIKDETSVNNQFSAGCSLKSVAHKEEYNSSIPEVEKEVYGSIEASPSLNCTPVRLPSDGGDQCIRFHIKEEALVPMATPLCSAGTTFVVEQENMPDHINTEAASIRTSQFLGTLPEENQESTNYTSKKVLDAVAAAEARKKRKELTKLKNLHGRQCRIRR